MQDAISAGAKGIAITVPDQTIGPAISKLASDAGVVLIATDDSDVDLRPLQLVADAFLLGRTSGAAPFDF